VKSDGSVIAVKSDSGVWVSVNIPARNIPRFDEVDAKGQWQGCAVDSGISWDRRRSRWAVSCMKRKSRDQTEDAAALGRIGRAARKPSKSS
jgi:hypothetical protein